LVWSRQMFWLDQMIVGMLVIGLVGFLMDAILGLAEARLQRWRVAGL
jgi:sulfonate transport system permease protein